MKKYLALIDWKTRIVCIIVILAAAVGALLGQIQLWNILCHKSQLLPGLPLPTPPGSPTTTFHLQDPARTVPIKSGKMYQEILETQQKNRCSQTSPASLH